MRAAIHPRAGDVDAYKRDLAFALRTIAQNETTRRIALEDIAALSSPTTWAGLVRNATRKAFTPETADRIMGND
jgi:hypothetical protein